MKTFSHNGKAILPTIDHAGDDLILLPAVDQSGKRVMVMFDGADARAMRSVGIPTAAKRTGDAMLSAVELPKIVSMGEIFDGAKRIIDKARKDLVDFVTPFMSGQVLSAEETGKLIDAGRTWTGELSKLSEKMKDDEEEAPAPDLNTNGAPNMMADRKYVSHIINTKAGRTRQVADAARVIGRSTESIDAVQKANDAFWASQK